MIWTEYENLKNSFRVDMTDLEFKTWLHDLNKLGMENGVKEGWWEDYDDNPLPKPVRFKISDLNETERTFAHILVNIGVFPSLSQARKNGYNKGLEPGEFWFSKRKKRVIIEP